MMKFDLHIHSCNSYDSFSSVKNIIKYAKKRRLNGIAITDHEKVLSDDYIDRYMDKDFWIIKGGEMCTEVGDIIGLFLSRPLQGGQNAVELIHAIHDQDGLAILAHPFKRTSYSYSEKILNMLDAVEVANARWRDLNLMPHNPEVSNLLSQVRGRSAGSDAHFSFEVGRAYLMTPYVTTQEELKKIICSGAGGVVCNHSSEWLDVLSQGIKFLKSPSIKQFLRLICWSGRHLIFSNRRCP